MTPEEIVRAWKDEEYRLSLSDEQLALLPQHPAGLVELSDEELAIVGGMSAARSSRYTYKAPMLPKVLLSRE